MDLPLLIAICACALVAALALAASLWSAQRAKASADAARERLEELSGALGESRREIEGMRDNLALIAQHTATEAALDRQRFEALGARINEAGERADGIRREVAQQLDRNRQALDARLTQVGETVDRQLTGIRSDSNTQLERMRQTVDEKLQRTLNERITQSFALVNESLDKVGRGLGEMQSLAADVGGLKRVLSGVKTRGILGEVQLGAILSEMLAPAQYARDVATVPGSANRVEFAVRLPGEAGEVVFLPIDAKFPGDAYEHLRDAVDSGDAGAADAAWKTLERRLKDEAKDIRDKYLAPPATTAFGIMFLPFEGLYAEVANRPGLIEELQRAYHVNVAGPSTMAALLNSLQMGFQTVAIQQRANEIQKVLSAVKTEFATYQSLLERAQKQLGTASRTIDSLVGTRSRAMERKLREITQLESLEEADAILGIAASAAPEDADDPVPAADVTIEATPATPASADTEEI